MSIEHLGLVFGPGMPRRGPLLGIGFAGCATAWNRQ
jgi:hypothetical protein